MHRPLAPSTRPTRRGLAAQALLGSAAAAALLAVPGQASAATITVDGKFDGSSAYQLGYTVGFLDDKGNAIGDGRLMFGIDDGGLQTLYFQMPLSYVDNTYGTNADPSWGGGGHKFDDLVGSDSLGSEKGGGTPFGYGGSTGVVDYVGGIGTCTTDKDGKVKCGDPVGYRSGGLGTIDDDGVNVKNEGSAVPGSFPTLLEVATSIEYNLLFVEYATTNSSLNPNWIKEVGYEFQFAAGTFNPADWLNPATAYSLITLGTPHVSPSKVKFGSYEDPVCEFGCSSVTPVPEPSSFLLFGTGLAAAGRAWRRRRAARSPSS